MTLWILIDGDVIVKSRFHVFSASFYVLQSPHSATFELNTTTFCLKIFDLMSKKLFCEILYFMTKTDNFTQSCDIVKFTVLHQKFVILEQKVKPRSGNMACEGQDFLQFLQLFQ